MCSAETMPKQLFSKGHLSFKDEEDNRKLMDDLGILGVGVQLYFSLVIFMNAYNLS